jgi:hypothetical protein
MSTVPLPYPRTVLTELLSQIQQATTPADTGNPLKNASEDTKKSLLTLHVLYPNEFLPALDLLDRRLLTRFTIQAVTSHEPGSSVVAGHSLDVTPSQHHSSSEITPLYFVRSAQQSRTSTSGRSYDPLTTHYEVRLMAWNCSCPAFSFAAFPPSARNDGDLQRSDEVHPFGGLSVGQDMPPICKHLLACVLAEHCLTFREFVEMKGVSHEELAGWCAGWGD